MYDVQLYPSPIQPTPWQLAPNGQMVMPMVSKSESPTKNLIRSQRRRVLPGRGAAIRPPTMLALVTTRLSELNTRPQDDYVLDPYDLYLLERSRCEAESEAHEELSLALEAAYLATLQGGVEEQRAVGSKRTSRETSTAWTHDAMSDSQGGMRVKQCDTPSELQQQLAEQRSQLAELPELSAWARAAAEQEARYNPAKRVRRSRDARDRFWRTVDVDVEGLCSLTLRED